jgi:ATP-dependent DNA helicase RecQ
MAVLRSTQKAVLRMPKQALAARGKRKRDDSGRGRRSAEASDLSGAQQALFDALRALRRELARELGVPPYVVFHDSTLADMAQAAPRDADELAQVRGVGAAKVAKFGERFLATIRAHGGAAADD